MTLNGFKNVLKRELKMMLSRPIYLFSTVFVMGFCYLFFLTLMNEGLPQRLPVAIVDQDQSTLSRRFYRELEATATTDVVLATTSYQEAREAMQRGEIFGFIVIPKEFYKDVLSYRRPEIAFYVNNSFLVAGTLTYKDFAKMAALASGAVQREILRAKGMKDDDIMGRVQPIVLDNHMIGNQWTNYGIYLINIALPGILQLMILLMTIYSIGIELKTKSSREWLKVSENSLVAGLAGKLLPYTILFTILGIAGNFLLYKIVHFPMHGSFLRLSFATFLFVLAYQAIGILIIGIAPTLRLAISGAALYGILAFSYTGFTFPVEAMPRLAQGATVLYPMRHYFKIYVNEALLNGGAGITVIHYGILLLFLAAPFIVYKRLKNALILQNYPLK